MSVSRKFLVKNGLDNNSQSIDNLGAAGASFALSGANAVILTSTGATNVTLPTTGTLATTSQLPTVNNATLTLAVSGSGLTGSQTFTSNQSTAVTFTVGSNATDLNTASTIVFRNASNNFAAGIGTFAGSGTASGITLNGTVTSATDATTKAYVDSIVAGLSWKLSVRAATTVDGALATAFANSQIIDGVTLVTGNRILIKNQAAPAENGIYTVNATGAPTRSTDADTSAELVNATVYVSEGSTLQDTGWTQTANSPITVNTTGLVWAQFSGSGSGVSSFSAGTTGLLPSSATTGAITLSGTLDANNGGTGFASYVIGDLLYASTTTALSKLASPVAGHYLRSNGASTAPTWSTLALPNAATVGDIMVASVANTYTSLADVATGNVLLSGGIGVVPSYGKVVLSAAGSAVTGVLPLANGGTNANITAINGGVTYSNATTLALTAAGSAGQVLVSNGAAAPTWSSSPTLASTTISSGGTPIGLVDGTLLVTSTTAAGQVVDSVAIAAYRAVHYRVAVTSGASYQYTEIALLHDGTTVYISEVNTMLTATSLATFDADILTGNMRLLVTPVNAVTTIKVVATAIAV